LHVLAARVREDRVPAEADELPLPHRYLQVGASVVSRLADPAGRARHRVWRAELAGTLHGLLRVRGFTQDDAHVFCTPESVRGEIGACLDFAFDLHRVFGFETFKVELSARGADSGKRYLGAEADWRNAEAALVSALDERSIPYRSMGGGGAFYGPRID